MKTNPKRDETESIIFYKYTGRHTKYKKPEDFINNTKASVDTEHNDGYTNGEHKRDRFIRYRDKKRAEKYYDKPMNYDNN